MAPPKASDGGRSVRLSLSFGLVMVATLGKLISNSALGIGEQEARLLEVTETACDPLKWHEFKL